MAVIRSGSHACPGEGLGYLRRSKQWLSHEGQATSSRLQMIEPVANLCVTIQRLKRQPEEALHKSRYVVIHEGGWQIRNAHRRVAATFPTKAQALCAAIELAERDGGHGQAPEVLVRHEDDRFITEWVYGDDLHPDDATRPAGKKQPGRSGA
jgi:hypothetical protein